MLSSSIIAPAASQAVAALAGGASQSDPAQTNSTASAPSFLGLINSALQDVSATQAAADTAQAGYAAGVPGASISKALVASDRAEVAWNATVAVRNEIVSAYQSIMNMQF